MSLFSHFSNSPDVREPENKPAAEEDGGTSPSSQSDHLAACPPSAAHFSLRWPLLLHDEGPSGQKIC